MIAVPRVSLLLLLLFSASAWGEDDPLTLKIGVIQSLTGIAAEDGTTVVQALRLAQDEINAAGKVRIELLIEDDASVARNSVAAFHKLVNAGVQAVIGATWDFTSNPLEPLAAAHRLPLISTSTFPECLGSGRAEGYGFATTTSVEAERLPLQRFLRLVRPTTAVLLSVSNRWGEVQHRLYKRVLTERRVRILEEIQSSSYDDNEWRTVIPRIKKGKPDTVFLVLNKQDIETFLRRARELGFSAAFYTSKNTWDSFRTSGTPEVFEDVCFSYPYHQLQAHPEFAAEYQRRYGEAPAIYADHSYDTLVLIAHARERQNPGEPLADSLKRTTYDGLAGSYRYDPEKSFSTGEPSLVCIEEGVPAEKGGGLN